MKKFTFPVSRLIANPFRRLRQTNTSDKHADGKENYPLSRLLSYVRFHQKYW